MSRQQEKYAEWIAWRGLIPADKYTEAIGSPPVFSTMWLGLDRHILVSQKFVNVGAMFTLAAIPDLPSQRWTDGKPSRLRERVRCARYTV